MQNQLPAHSAVYDFRAYVCAWFKWICLFVGFELGVRQCGDADASLSV